MRSYRSGRWLYAVSFVMAAIGLLVLASSVGATRAHAQQPLGLGAPILVGACMDVTLVVQPSDANYTSVFWRDSAGTLGVTNKQAGTPISLNAVPAGELILGIVVNETGEEMVFQVSRSRSVTADTPLQEVLNAPAAGSSLTLFTCGGTFDRGAGEYDQRLVVNAVRIANGAG